MITPDQEKKFREEASTWAKARYLREWASDDEMEGYLAGRTASAEEIINLQSDLDESKSLVEWQLKTYLDHTDDLINKLEVLHNRLMKAENYLKVIADEDFCDSLTFWQYAREYFEKSDSAGETGGRNE